MRGVLITATLGESLLVGCRPLQFWCIPLKDVIQAVPWSCVAAGKSSRPDFFGDSKAQTFGFPHGRRVTKIVRYEPETYFGRWENHSYFPSPSDGVFSVGEGRVVTEWVSVFTAWFLNDKAPINAIAAHIFPYILGYCII